MLALLYGIASVGNLIGIYSKTFLSHFHDIIGKFLQVLPAATMQGRDGRGFAAIRGRCRNGRGGRGKARPPPRTGTVAAIGAYLDLAPGKEVNPGVATNWVNKFREFVPTVCDTPKISLIIRIDATLGAYPIYVTPELPAAACSIFVANMGDSLC